MNISSLLSKVSPGTLRVRYPVFTSKTITFPRSGLVIVRAMGAGGSGAARVVSTQTGTGGYSACWGMKILRVAAGDTAVITIGAGSVTPSNGNGLPGGNTSVTIGGETYTAPGGPGGMYQASGVPSMPSGPELPANWDFGAASVRPGFGSNIGTGGAGVDILAQGNNATTSASVQGSGGGGTGSPSTGPGGGGSLPGGLSALGTSGSSAVVAIAFDASQGEWGISFYGGSGGAAAGGIYGHGANGGGGGNGGTTAVGNGGNGGGGAGAMTNGALGGNGGFGAGGGCGTAYGGGKGGDGYVFLDFFGDAEV